jgi:hypothetical protein
VRKGGPAAVCRLAPSIAPPLLPSHGRKRRVCRPCKPLGRIAIRILAQAGVDVDFGHAAGYSTDRQRRSGAGPALPGHRCRLGDEEFVLGVSLSTTMCRLSLTYSRERRRVR